MGRNIAPGNRAPYRSGSTDPDGAGREIDGVRVLRAAGVALKAAKGTQLGQVPLVEPAQKVVDGVQTGDACGFTETRSPALRCSKYRAVMMLTIDADDAWCPPTFTPSRAVRTLLA